MYGPGVENGALLSTFVSAFICDVSRAIENGGDEKGRLKVSVSGPKGNAASERAKLFVLGCVTWLFIVA